MRATHDEGAARQQPQTSSKNTNACNPSNLVGHSHRPAPTYALATVFLTRTTRGGLSVVAVVECPFDRGHLHLHRASLDFTSGRRRAGCGAGSYIVHVGALESGVAA